MTQTEISKKTGYPFMRLGVISAGNGVANGHGGPFGACIIRDDQVIAVSHNTVLLSKNPCNHAEVTCIRKACEALGTWDLSDCVLYTTCEPCPMCWGATYWSRIKKMMIGCTRETAKVYGFDDAYFYQELSLPLLNRALPARVRSQKKDINEYIESTSSYKFLHRHIPCNYPRVYSYSSATNTKIECAIPFQVLPPLSDNDINKYMTICLQKTKEATKKGENTGKEIFGCLIVKDDNIIAYSSNKMIKNNDATMSAETEAIKLACQSLDTYCLDGCRLFSLIEPDVMSMCAILWSRISEIHVGLTIEEAASKGYVEGLLQYNELNMEEKERTVEVEREVLGDECEDVFRGWQKQAGTVY